MLFARSDLLTWLPGLSEEMYEDNIKGITNIDISDTCIVDMKKRCVAMEDMRCASPYLFLNEPQQ